MSDEYLMHYGVLGMKWGVRKKSSSVSSGGSKKLTKSKKTSKSESRVSKVKKSISDKLAEVDKEKIKDVAKTSAIIAGKVAVAATLGSIGMLAINEASKHISAGKVEQSTIYNRFTVDKNTGQTVTSDPRYRKTTLYDSRGGADVVPYRPLPTKTIDDEYMKELKFNTQRNQLDRTRLYDSRGEADVVPYKPISTTTIDDEYMKERNFNSRRNRY